MKKNKLRLTWILIYFITTLGYVITYILEDAPVTLPEPLTFLENGYDASVQYALRLSTITALTINLVNEYFLKEISRRGFILKLASATLFTILHSLVFIFYTLSYYKLVNRYIHSVEDFKTIDSGLNSGMNKLISLNNTFIPLRSEIKDDVEAELLRMHFEELMAKEGKKRKIDYEKIGQKK